MWIPADGKPEEWQSLYACRQAKQPEGSHARSHFKNVRVRIISGKETVLPPRKSAQPPSFYYSLQNTETKLQASSNSINFIPSIVKLGHNIHFSFMYYIFIGIHKRLTEPMGYTICHQI